MESMMFLLTGKVVKKCRHIKMYVPLENVILYPRTFFDITHKRTLWGFFCTSFKLIYCQHFSAFKCEMTDCYLIKKPLSRQFELHLLLKKLSRVRHDDKLNKGHGDIRMQVMTISINVILLDMIYYMALWAKDKLEYPLASLYRPRKF